MMSPCMNCENRNEHCHGTCVKYKDYKNTLEQINENKRKSKHLNEYYYNNKHKKRR